MISKCVEIAYLVRVEKANLNASGTEGNVTLLKKVRDVDGNEYVYVSGVATKYWIKEMLRELPGIKLSPVLSKGEENPHTKKVEDQITSYGDPETYIDDDLFGYLLPNAKLKRIAPIKTNGLISIFPYAGDINRGVRYDPKGEEHSLWDIEITNTILRGNWILELDRIGKFEESEVKEKKKKELQPNVKEERIKAFLHCFFNLFGGAKQSTFLTSTEPRVVVVIFLDQKRLVINDRLKLSNEDFLLDQRSLLQSFELHKDVIKEVYVGIDESIVRTNLEELQKAIEDKLGKDKKVEVANLANIKQKLLSPEFKLFW